jgi:hypothetical protein
MLFNRQLRWYQSLVEAGFLSVIFGRNNFVTYPMAYPYSNILLISSIDLHKIVESSHESISLEGLCYIPLEAIFEASSSM